MGDTATLLLMQSLGLTPSRSSSRKGSGCPCGGDCFCDTVEIVIPVDGKLTGGAYHFNTQFSFPKDAMICCIGVRSIRVMNTVASSSLPLLHLAAARTTVKPPADRKAPELKDHAPRAIGRPGTLPVLGDDPMHYSAFTIATQHPTCPDACDGALFCGPSTDDEKAVCTNDDDSKKPWCGWLKKGLFLGVHAFFGAQPGETVEFAGGARGKPEVRVQLRVCYCVLDESPSTRPAAPAPAAAVAIPFDSVIGRTGSKPRSSSSYYTPPDPSAAAAAIDWRQSASSSSSPYTTAAAAGAPPGYPMTPSSLMPSVSYAWPMMGTGSYVSGSTTSAAAAAAATATPAGRLW